VFAFVVLALSRAGDARSVDAWRRARAKNAPAFRRPVASPEYTWPFRSIWVLMSLVFFGAGTSKLRHSGIEWALSDNLRLLLLRSYYHVSDGDPLTSWSLSIAQHAHLAQTVAAATLAIETLFFVCLLSRRARPYIGFGGLMFLVGIRALMGPTFEPFIMCGLLPVPWHRVEAAVRRMVERPRTVGVLDAAYDYMPTADAAGAQPSLETRAPQTRVLDPA
jgi:hypothetical protein